MKKFLYSNRILIALSLLVMTIDIIYTHLFTNSKTTIWIYFDKWGYYKFHTLMPVYYVLLIAFLYNVLFQWNGVKEDKNEDNILDS